MDFAPPNLFNYRLYGGKSQELFFVMLHNKF